MHGRDTSVARLSALVAALSVSTCSEEPYQLRVHVPGGASRATTVEISVLATCDGLEIGEPVFGWYRRIEVDRGMSNELGWLRAGRYGFYGRAWDALCNLYAAACEPVEIEAGGGGLIEIRLAELETPQGCDPGTSCAGGRCVSDGVCDAPRAECAGVCTDVLFDPLHCGDCDVACAADETCERGGCV